MTYTIVFKRKDYKDEVRYVDYLNSIVIPAEMKAEYPKQFESGEFAFEIYKGKRRCKTAYYHDRGKVHSTWSYSTYDSVRQIKSNIVANNCILDAIKYDNKKVTRYTKHYSVQDYLDN